MSERIKCFLHYGAMTATERTTLTQPPSTTISLRTYHKSDRTQTKHEL